MEQEYVYVFDEIVESNKVYRIEYNDELQLVVNVYIDGKLVVQDEFRQLIKESINHKGVSNDTSI